MIDSHKRELENFVNANMHPYDQNKDNYEKKPFDKPVKAGKNTPIYNAHAYHTKVPHQGIIPFIEHYTEPGDLILDPFCGSGMTGVAALLCPSGSRHVILNDLSPAAIHIASNYCTPVNVNELKNGFDRIKSAVKEEFDWLYETYHTDSESGEKIPAMIQYTIWSDVYRCHPKKRNTEKHPINPDGCGMEIILWDVAIDRDTGKVKDKFKCPNPKCGETWKKTELKRVRSVPVVTNYVYTDPKTNKKQRAEHPVTEFELRRIKEIESKEIPYWYPSNSLEKKSEMYIRCALHLRNIERASDFYTKRNLWALSRMWKETETFPPRLFDAYKFLLTAININVSRMWKYKADRKGGSVSGTLYIPSLSIEQNVLGVISRKTKNVYQALSLGNKSAKVFTAIQSATSLDIPKSCVDYIFTDPPFGSNIFYADCSFLWESWLGEFMDESKEAVWNKSRKPSIGGKTLEDYKNLMFESFQEMHRLLKPNRWATVVFSNSNDRVWEAIQDAAHHAGFIIYGGKEFDKIQRSFKGIRGEKGLEKVISKDVLLNLHKPRVPLVRNGELKKVDDIEGFVLQQIKVYLQYLPPDSPTRQRTVEAITRAVQRRVLEEGYSMKGFGASYVADVLHEARGKFQVVEIDGAWYLSKGELSDLLVRDESSAILWLTRILSEDAKRLDEVDPLWKQEKLKGGYRGEKGLQEILDDFFIENRDGAYRVPDEHERKALKGQVDERSSRDCERYLAGALRREPSVEEKFNWIEFLTRKEEWKKILDIERTLVLHKDWKQLSGGKDTLDRIRLAKTMLIQKKESLETMKQKTLF